MVDAMLRLTQLRMRQNLSKAKLGRLAELDGSFLSKVEAGRIKPYPRQLTRLAVALGLNETRAASLLDEVG